MGSGASGLNVHASAESFDEMRPFTAAPSRAQSPAASVTVCTVKVRAVTFITGLENTAVSASAPPAHRMCVTTGAVRTGACPDGKPMGIVVSPVPSSREALTVKRHRTLSFVQSPA